MVSKIRNQIRMPYNVIDGGTNGYGNIYPYGLDKPALVVVYSCCGIFYVQQGSFPANRLCSF